MVMDEYRVAVVRHIIRQRLIPFAVLRHTVHDLQYPAHSRLIRGRVGTGENAAKSRRGRVGVFFPDDVHNQTPFHHFPHYTTSGTEKESFFRRKRDFGQIDAKCRVCIVRFDKYFALIKSRFV
jgi:hypothetical protein